MTLVSNSIYARATQLRESMIVILKREDLLPEHVHQSVDDLHLEHFRISSELIGEVELIVFVEGTAIRFLKHREDIQSKNSFDVFLRYITSTPPKERPSFRIKKTQRQKKTE